MKEEIIYLLLLANFVFLLWLLLKRNPLILFVWPLAIYGIGPYLTYFFRDNPLFSEYIVETRIVYQTVLVLECVLIFVWLAFYFRIPALLTEALQHTLSARAVSSQIFFPFYVLTSAAAAGLQSFVLLKFGTLLSGSYVLAFSGDGLIPYWGFLGGLYEIIFVLFVLFVLSPAKKNEKWYFVVLLYMLTTSLRVLGGTRLIIIKELSVILIFLYLKQKISTKKLIAVSVFGLVMGSVVGMLRAGADDDIAALTGPFYGLVMESAFNALTIGIADQVNQSGFTENNANLVDSILFYSLNIIPGFLRFGLSEESMADMNPGQLGIKYGFDTFAPVGGLSGFATLYYISAFPLLLFALLIFLFFATIRNIGSRNYQRIIILMLAVNSINFWRDPSEIAIKIFLQGCVVCFILFLTSSRYLSSTKINIYKNIDVNRNKNLRNDVF